MMYSLLSDTCKWMSAINDYKSLAHIPIPGTHESCSRKGAANVTPDLDSIIATQYYECTITKQLSAGIRYLDMRCCIVDDKLAVYQGDYYLNIDFDEVLNECLTFLAKNKSEVIIIRIRRETTPTAKKKFMDVFTRRYAKFLDKMYLMPQIPLIGEVRGKIVLLSNESILSSIHQSLTRVQDDFSLMRASDKLEKVLAFIQETIKANRKPTIKTLYINHCNAMKPPCLCPQSFAQDLLKLLIKSFKEGLKGEHVDFARYEAARIGIIVMDFYTEAMVVEIIKRNENKHLHDFPILTIANKNRGQNYLYASLYMDDDMARRHVFGWAPGHRVNKGYWMFINHADQKDEFFIMNNYYKEYLYASSRVEENRRSVFTWIAGVPTPENIWTVKDGHIYNNFYKCYLYESSLYYNDDRKIIPCWTADEHVEGDLWKFTRENE